MRSGPYVTSGLDAGQNRKPLDAGFRSGGGMAGMVPAVGAHDAYSKDAKVSHNGKHWTSTVDSNVWEPGVYGWTEV